MDENPNGQNLPDALSKIGFTLDNDGVLRADKLENWSIGPLNTVGQCTIKSPDGKTYTIDGVNKIEIKNMTVGGGTVGIDLG